MHRQAIFAAFLVLSLSAATGLAPASGQSVDAFIDSVDAGAYPSLSVTVTVLDGGGRPIGELTEASFQATAGDRALPVLSAASAIDGKTGINVVLALDTSGSMNGQPLEQAKAAGRALLDQLSPLDQVAVLAFADRVDIVQAFTGDRNAVATSLGALSSTGNTALYEGVAEAGGLSATGDLPRRAVVLLSDGQDFGQVSRTDRSGSLAAATAAGAPFFIVGLGNAIDRPYLEELATVTRGLLLLAPDAEDLTALFQSIGAKLRQQYVLSLDASALPMATDVVLRISVAYNGATAVTETPFTTPGVQPAPQPSPKASGEEQSPPVPSQQPQPATDADGSFPLVALALPVAAAFAVLLLAWRIIRRRRRALPDVDYTRAGSAQETPSSHPEPEPPPQTAREIVRATLTLAPPASGASYALGREPVTVGFSADCDVRLRDGQADRWERVRIWPREGRYMLHTLSRRGTVLVGGRSVEWAVLEEGDEIQLGPCHLTFRRA